MSTSASPRLPFVIAHRGASHDALENTVAAVLLADHVGADGVEFDVQLSADGVPVLFHDDDLSVLGGRSERIADLPLSELRRITLRKGSHTDTIATLDEALAACGERMPVLNIELKYDPRAACTPESLARAVLHAVNARSLDARVLASSFVWSALDVLADLAPWIRTAALIERSDDPDRAFSARPRHVQAVHPHASHIDPGRGGRPDRVCVWRAAGIACNVWTVDDAASIERLCAAGVTGLITNKPRETRETVDRVSAGWAIPPMY